MIKCTSIGTLGVFVAVVALAAQVGCSKDEKKDAAKKPMPAKTAPAKATPPTTAVKAPATPATATTTAAKASTKLLALKFHHDD